MSDYASVADVTARLPYRDFSSTTEPSIAQITMWIDEAEATVNGVLGAIGVTVPITSTSGMHIVRPWVCDYAEGYIRTAFAASGGDGGNTDGTALLERFRAQIQSIMDNPTIYTAMFASSLAGTPQTLRQVRGYVLDNSDGKSIADVAPQWKKPSSGSNEGMF